MSGYILAIDQGTTSSRAIVFDGEMRIRRRRPEGSFTQIYPQSAGLSTIRRRSGKPFVSTVRQALRRPASRLPTWRPSASPPARNGGWSGRRGEQRQSPSHNAIVWQDRRTASYCEKLKRQDLERPFTPQDKPACSIPIFFSAPKLSVDARQTSRAPGRGRRGVSCASAPSTPS